MSGGWHEDCAFKCAVYLAQDLGWKCLKTVMVISLLGLLWLVYWLVVWIVHWIHTFSSPRSQDISEPSQVPGNAGTQTRVPPGPCPPGAARVRDGKYWGVAAIRGNWEHCRKHKEHLTAWSVRLLRRWLGDGAWEEEGDRISRRTRHTLAVWFLPPESVPWCLRLPVGRQHSGWSRP